MSKKNIDVKRRSVLKFAVLFAAVPFVDSLNRTNLLAAGLSNFSTNLIKNGQVLSAAHWGMLKLTIKNGKIVKSEPYNKQATDIENPLQYYTQDLVYAKDRIMYPMVRKSYLEDPNNSKPELRGKDEWVRVPYEKAIKLIAEQLKKTRDKKGVVQDKQAIKKARDNFLSKAFSLKWKLVFNHISKLQGKEGNEEEFFYFSR